MTLTQTFAYLSAFLLMIAYYIELLKTPDDHEHLQSDLNSLIQRTMQWEMKLNPEKCITLRCTRSLTPYQVLYSINKQPLQVVDQYTYLGVRLHSSMAWAHHIQAIVNKETKIKKTIFKECYTNVILK